MDFNIIERNEGKIAVVDHRPGEQISSAQEALELLVNCIYSGSDRLIIHESGLHRDFFDLKTRLAGDILQKFSNYGGYLAIIGDYSNIKSKSLRDFIYESNFMGRINFVADEEEGINALMVKV